MKRQDVDGKVWNGMMNLSEMKHRYHHSFARNAGVPHQSIIKENEFHQRCYDSMTMLRFVTV
jgi:hypothetical protein